MIAYGVLPERMSSEYSLLLMRPVPPVGRAMSMWVSGGGGGALLSNVLSMFPVLQVRIEWARFWELRRSRGDICKRRPCTPGEIRTRGALLTVKCTSGHCCRPPKTLPVAERPVITFPSEDLLFHRQSHGFHPPTQQLKRHTRVC